MNKTINFNTDDPEELQKMMEQQNEEAEEGYSENACDESFMGAFEEHVQEFEQAKSDGLGSLQELEEQEQLLNAAGAGEDHQEEPVNNEKPKDDPINPDSQATAEVAAIKI